AGLDILTEGGSLDNPVLSTVKDGVGMMAGTSVAAARATGVVSLVWAANPDLSYRQVIDIFKLTAVDVKTPGWDAETGAGLLNAIAAIELAKKTTPQDYTPFSWVAPFTWDGEGKVTPSDRAASGGNTLATAAVQPDPNFSDSDTVDVNNREKYYEVTIEQPGYLRYTVTRTNGTEWLPSVEWLRTDGKPVSRQFSFAPTGISGGAAGGGGDANSTSMTRGIFVEPGTYYLKTSLVNSYQSPEFWLDPPVQYTTVQNYDLSTAFIPDLPATFSGAAQFKTPDGQRVAELNISSLVNYDPANPDSAKVQYWLDVSEPGNLTLKIGSSADKIGLLAKKIIGQGDANSEGQILFSSGAIRPDQAQSLQLLNLNKGRYLLEVYPRRGSNNQPFIQPFTINGFFSRQAPNPGEGQVPSNAGTFAKTVTSNGVDTHYYANGYLSVQPSGYATWYTYGAGVPLPTISGATQPGASVPPFSTLGLGTPTPVTNVPPDYAGNSFNQARNIGVLNGTQTFQDFLGDADPSDYYRFELNNDSNLNWRVDGLNPGVDFQLYKATNNGIELQWSTNTPAPNFSSDMAGTYPGTPGTYYIRLKPFASGGSNYNFSLSAISRNTAPENLQFNLTKSSYSYGETVRLDAKVFDRNGATDISKVEFYYKQNGTNWQYLGKNESFTPDGNWANFYFNITNAPAANYEVMATAYDWAGLGSNTVTGAFQVTAPFDINASRWFPGDKILSGEMLAEYDRLVAQGNYLGNPSFVDTSPAKSYFGTDVQRAFFPSRDLGYTSIWKSQYGTFSLSGAIADYYTNYYFRKYGDDISRRNPSLPDGLFHIYSGLGVPISPIYKQADGSEVAYFEGGMLTNRNGVVTPNYNQNAKHFELVGQGAPNGELQWKNDYSYWNWKSVGQPTSPVRRINNGWIQEFTGSIDSAGDSIFLLKDGQSVEGGNDLNNIPNGGPYRVQGEILKAYRSVGGQDGVLGFPVISQERAVNGYKAYLEFENGSIGIDFNDRTIIKDKLGRNIWPNISANHWNARFINRNQGNVADYNSYDFTNPAAVVDLGEQKQGNGLIGLHKDFGEGSPANGVQNDYFAMLAWTRTYLEAGKTYKITTQSDDGTWFMLKKAGTDNWINNLAPGNDGGDWRDRSATEPAKTVQFKVNESGEYDFHVQYYDKTGFSTINVNLEETQPFPTNPQPQTSIWSQKVNGVLDGLNGEFQITAPKGGYAGECVSFVKRFTQSLGVNMNPMGGEGPGKGGARFGFINFNKPGLSLSSTQADKIVFTGNEQPQVGDIIFFDKTSSNPYGHVAVVQSVLGDGRVIIQESNANGKAPNTYVTRGEINLNAKPPRRGLGAVMGWLRLKNSESVSSGSGSSGGGFASGGGNPIGGGSPSGGGDPGSFPGSSGTTAFPYISITSTSDAADGDTNVTPGGTINIRGKLKNEQTVNFYLGNTQLTTDYITKDGEDFYGSFRIPNSVAPESYQVKAIVNSSQGFYADALGQLINVGYSSLWQPTENAEGGNFNVGIIPFDNLGNNGTQIIRTNATNTWVVSHGFTGSPNNWNINNLARGLDEIVDGKWLGINTLIGSNDQVLVVDWSQGADRWLIDYGTGASRVDDAGREVADMLRKAGVNPQSVNFIGHSLGAYVSAYAAQNLGEVNTLTLLDPAIEFSINTLVNAPRFDNVSKFATQFGSTTTLGTQRTTADESYWVDFAGINFNDEHGDVVTWFIDNLRRPNTSPYGTMQSFDMLTNRPRTSKLNLNMNYNDRNGWEATLISERRTDGWWTSRNEIWKGKVDRSELPGVAYG
ncbi:MAG TPA: hypothetical protein DDW76_01455, partial [Cyanobacteria bacterium UBA11369]|nr:hypothetical protein [Cyanobacteria bacterium UBA11371]HBE47499.1 hypothetical protein [Cyanobacteria bacterium UBA11369]